MGDPATCSLASAIWLYPSCVQGSEIFDRSPLDFSYVYLVAGGYVSGIRSIDLINAREPHTVLELMSAARSAEFGS